jgi:hypothetical protein
MKSGNMFNVKMTEYVLEQTLAKKGLPPCYPLAHPKHLYALGSMDSARSASSRVGVGGGDTAEASSLLLVSPSETQALIEHYSSQHEEE